MNQYIPMKGPYPGQQFIPSNGTQGEAFIAGECGRCERDRIANGTVDQDDTGDDDMCPILGASFGGDSVEWRELEDGTCKCLAFIPMGEKVPVHDDFTVDMFGGGS